MARHIMVINEADPNHPHCSRRYYATIEVSLAGAPPAWVWHQIDANGMSVRVASSSFQSEDDAKDDALQALNGDYWE